MPAEAIPILRQLAPFSSLPPQASRYLQPRLRRVLISARKRLVQQGERGSFVAIIGRGQVDLVSASGKTLTLGAGQSFGLGISYHGIPSAEVMVTRSEVVLWVILGGEWQTARNPSALPVEMDPRISNAAVNRPRQTWRRILLSVSLIGLTLVVLGAAPLHSTHNLVTKLALETGHPDLAEKYLRMAAFLQPDYARVYDALGYSLFIQGKEAEALGAFSQAVTLDAENASAQNNLGVALLQETQVAQALPHMQAAVELDPSSPQAYFNLGNAYLASGDLEAAAQAYQMAFELDPDLLDARALWAGVVLRQNRLEEARQAWEQVIAVDPTHQLAQRGLGVIAVMESQPDKAVTHLKAALVSQPDDPIARFYLGLALKELGRLSEADVEFGAALANSRDPALSLLIKTNLLTNLK